MNAPTTTPPAAYRRILVPVDGSPTSQRGLQEAIALARLTGGALRLVHIVDELIFATGFEGYSAYAADVVPAMKRAGEEILAAAARLVASQGPTPPLECSTVLIETLGRRVADLIDEQARQWPADLIVLGTHGRRGVRRYVLGSDAEQVLRCASVPVLLIRAPEPSGAD